VLLFVMLLGMFPFEMEDENYVNTAGAAAGQQRVALYSICVQVVQADAAWSACGNKEFGYPPLTHATD
jgi:hypothetical protein